MTAKILILICALLAATANAEHPINAEYPINWKDSAAPVTNSATALCEAKAKDFKSELMSDEQSMAMWEAASKAVAHMVRDAYTEAGIDIELDHIKIDELAFAEPTIVSVSKRDTRAVRISVPILYGHTENEEYTFNFRATFGLRIEPRRNADIDIEATNLGQTKKKVLICKWDARINSNSSTNISIENIDAKQRVTMEQMTPETVSAIEALDKTLFRGSKFDLLKQ